MKKVDRLSLYYSLRKHSRKLKYKRFISRRNKTNRHLRQTSLYNNTNFNIIEEHNFANITAFKRPNFQESMENIIVNVDNIQYLITAFRLTQSGKIKGLSSTKIIFYL